MDAATAAASREREEMAIMQQQHQQQWLQAAMMSAQQNHLELQSQMPHVLLPHALHPHHPNAPQGFAPPPSHSVEHGQPMFNFPSPEEMAARQRMAAAQQMGLLEHFGMPPPGVLPPGFHPGLLMENVAHSAGRMEEHAGGGAGGGGMVPTAHFMPAELVAQQQQAALVAAAAGGSPGIPMTPENVMEFQRQFEIMWQQVQKEPELLRHPQIQIMIQQRNRLVAMQQGAAMQEHYQRMHELSLLQQQQQQQQQEMHKQLANKHACTALTVENILTAVQRVPWRKLGEKLFIAVCTRSGDQFTLSYPKLDEIEGQHQSDESRLRAVIECWLQGDGKDKEPSWRRIIWELDDENETRSAADSIRHFAELLPGTVLQSKTAKLLKIF